MEIYVFLKEFLDNKRIEQIFKDWYEKEGVFADRAEGGVARDDGQIGLFEDVSQKQYEDVFKAMRKNARAYAQPRGGGRMPTPPTRSAL